MLHITQMTSSGRNYGKIRHDANGAILKMLINFLKELKKLKL